MNSRFLQVVLWLIAIFAAAVPALSSAATFYFSPATGSYSAGDRFTVRLLIDSSDQAINAAEASISFPVRFLKVESVSSANSVFTFWSAQPTFSNTAGNIRFGGGLPSPGTTSPNAQVLSIRFQALGGGSARVQVESGDILANDGLGTNILSSSQDANYDVNLPTTSPSSAPSGPSGSSGQPQITSSTHPDQNKWSNRDTFQASWNMSAAISGVSYALVGDSSYTLPNADKGVVAETSYDLTKFNDGIWYFYIKFRSDSGWGPTAKYQVKVDRTPPAQFSIVRAQNSDDPTDPHPVFDWSATDRTSGIDHYSVKIGDGDWFDAGTILQDGHYTLPAQAPGDHLLTVRAVDAAGNFTEANTTFTVQPIASPDISDYSKSVSGGEALTVHGTGSPGWTILLSLAGQNTTVSFSAQVDPQGRWAAEYKDILPAGAWQLRATAEDSRGALSLSTPAVPVQVSGWFSRLWPVILNWGAVAILAALVLGALLAVIIYLVHRLRMWRTYLSKDLRKLQKELRKDLSELDEELRPLTSNQVDLSPTKVRKSREKLRKEVARLEEDVQQEVRNIDHLTGQ